MKWQNVYIFISSTFNDMHAERDYLIKRVFPELRLWCADHKLKLIDIDLRWGVSEKDATENKRVVEVCLNNVDRCRPFLLSLLGQRRGWVPGLGDINHETLVKYPGLQEYIGKHSITELEIIHGLLHPLADGTPGMRHAFFYHRKPDYMDHIRSPQTRRVFEMETDDAFMEVLRQTYGVTDYTARWNPEKVSPELKNVQGMDLSQGRLEQFQVGDLPLASVVSTQLKTAIEAEFPEHFAVREEPDDLGLEWNHQDTFLFSASDSYISRQREEEKILDYFLGNSNKPCVFMADAGSGKTSMLAWLISENRIPATVIYRFVGTSSASSDVNLTLTQLAEELTRKGFLSQENLEDAKSNILLKFPTLISKLKGQCHMILDGVDQWNHVTPASFKWLPEQLPENVKILLSVKKDGQPEIVHHLTRKDYVCIELSGISEDGEKTAMIVGYLSTFLKDIDEKQIGHILRLPGSGNPLYLKIVLQELRIHGSFDTLMDQLQKNYGTTPREAFQMVLDRLEGETFGAGIPSQEFVKYVLGTISCATEGVCVEELGKICKHTISTCKTMLAEDIMDAVYGLIRHLSAYLVIDGNRVSFLYDSFRQAVNERYRESYTQFHHLLAQMYASHCYATGGSEYDVSETTCLTNAIYHGIECGKAWAEAFLTDPWFVYRLLSKTSAGQAAGYFRRTADKYEDSGAYREIANFMERYSMRLNMGPNTLFYMLKQHVGFRNPLAYQLCYRASKVMDLEYFYPVREEFSESLRPDRELDLYSGGKYELIKPEPFVWGQYVIYVEGDTVLLQNMYTEEIEKQTVLPRFAHRAYVNGDYLYIHYRGEKEAAFGDLETFRLPQMESVFFQDYRPPLPEKFSWYTIACGAEGVQYQYSMDYNETFPELFVYNMNTGKVQIHSVFPEDTPKKADYSYHEATWCGEYLKEEIGLFQKCRIWHVPTGTMLLEAEDCWHYHIACEKQDMWFVTITKEGNLISYHFQKNSDGGVLLVGLYKASSQQLRRVKQIGVLDGNVYLFFDSGDFWVLDETFRFLGRQKLPFKIDRFSVRHFSGNQFLYSTQEYLFFLINSQVLLFDKQKCMASLLGDMELSKATEQYTTLHMDNRLVLLERQGNHVLNLRTMKYEYSKKYPGYAFYEPTCIPVGSREYIADCRSDGKLFEMLMINSNDLSVGLRFHDKLPEGTRRTELAFYQNGIACVMFWNGSDHMKEVREHKVNPELHEEIKERKLTQESYETYTIAYFDTRNNFQCVDIWRPEIYTCFKGVMYYCCQKTPYLVFTDVYVDAEHSEIQIYHAMTKELVYAYRYDHTSYNIGSKDEFFEMDECLFVRMYHYETTTYHFLEIDLNRRIIEKHPIPTRQLSGRYGRQLYFYQSFDRTILIYDLDKNKELHEITPRQRLFCYGVFRKGDRLIICLSGGSCEVYDANTMAYLYSQMLMPSFSVVKDLKNTDLIYVSSNSSDYAIFKAGSTRTLMET